MPSDAKACNGTRLFHMIVLFNLESMPCKHGLFSTSDKGRDFMEKDQLDELIELIKTLLEQKDYRQIKALLSNTKPQDTALLLQELSDKEIPLVFRLLSKELGAETFVEMDVDNQEMLINVFSDAELKAVFDEMFLDDTIDIIEEMPANVVKRIIKQADTETRQMINQVLQYPKDSAGSIMTVEYVSLKKKWTVKECFDHIRKIAVDKETIYNCYVTDDKRVLLGIITVKQLLLNSYTTTIEEIMEMDVLSVETTDDKEYVSQQIAKYDLSAIPVVDAENRMVGIVTVDDILDIIEEETNEDIAKMAAIVPSTTPYLQQSIWSIFVSRAPWLLILLISATFTSIVINHYEATLTTLLFACVPMIMGTGGNAANQASTTITRSLAIEEIEIKDIWAVLWKEIRVSLCIATILAITCFGKLLLIDNLLLGNEYLLDTCFAISLALFLTIILAKLIGCLMPLLAKICKLDPAVVASPFITTIIDVLSLIIYCKIVIFLLN